MMVRCTCAAARCSVYLLSWYKSTNADRYKSRILTDEDTYVSFKELEEAPMALVSLVCYFVRDTWGRRRDAYTWPEQV
jgi:hypothetical protein